MERIRYSTKSERFFAALSAAIVAVAFLMLLDPFEMLWPVSLRPKTVQEDIEELSRYKTRWNPHENLINVHLIPHTHDDAGWQVSVDEYQMSQVDVIIDNVILQLEENPDRRFTYAEIAFFATWYRRQSKAMQARVRTLVKEGRLEFVNGGWVQHDEACPNFIEMIDQTTRGHLWLKKHLNVIPTIGWQLDPFGHSYTQAWLLTKKVGLHAMFFGRSDYRELAMRYGNSSLEYFWDSSKSMGSKSRIFAAQLFGQGKYGGYYSWYPFEETNARDRNYVQDDLTMQDYNVDQWIEKIVQAAKHQASQTQTNHQLWMLGNDFTFQSASRWFTNYDKLIHYVNLDGRVRIFYSTPSNYFKSKIAAAKASNAEFGVRKSDMMPLADGPHEYWTGYFTSRPAMKRQFRYTSSLLGAVRQLEFLANYHLPHLRVQRLNDSTWRTPSSPLGAGWSDDLEAGLAIVAHHDGVTGTARQSVTNDYAYRLALGASRAEFGALQVMETLAGVVPKGPYAVCNCNTGGTQDCGHNMSTCSFTSSRTAFTIVVWNPLAQTRNTVIEMPVKHARYIVEREDGTNEDLAATAPIDAITKGLPLLHLNDYGLSPEEVWEESLKLVNPASHRLFIPVSVPPLGFSTFRVSSLKNSENAEVARSLVSDESGSTVEGLPVLENEFYRVELAWGTQRISSIYNKRLKKRFPFQIEWGYYRSSVGGCTKEKPDPGACFSQASGAYLFRPNETDLYWQSITPTSTRFRKFGTLGGELVQTYNEWISHTVRLLKHGEAIEVEFTVGPIPIYDDWGKEVIVRYSIPGLKSHRRFYTDSNGREMVERIRNHRSNDFCIGIECRSSLKHEPVAGNYYPVNSVIAVADAAHELAVVVDASQGGASLKDGEIELMVHRRTLVDDYRGVEEPLNETMCGCGDINADPGRMGKNGHLGDGGCGCPGLAIRGKHWLILDEIDEAHRARRLVANHVANPVQVGYFENPIKEDGHRKDHNVSSLLRPHYMLPENVQLLTLCSNYENGTLVRFAHLYESGEHPQLSSTVTLSLKNMFLAKVKSVLEYSLSGNQPLAKVIQAQKDLDWGIQPVDSSLHSGDDFKFDLRPMDVVTFWVQFEAKK